MWGMLVGFLWFSNDFKKDSIVCHESEIRTATAFNFRTHDPKYICLNEQKLKDFVYKYFDSHLLAYDKKMRCFPDCDDFANICFADILRGAIRQGFDYQPAFGVASVTLANGRRHMLNFAVTSEHRLLFYEPQSKKWLENSKEILFVHELIL